MRRDRHPFPPGVQNRSHSCNNYHNWGVEAKRQEAWAVGQFPISAAGSEGRRNTCAQFTRWSLEAQSFSRALIETQRDLVQLGLRVAGKVGSLRQVLTQIGRA